MKQENILNTKPMILNNQQFNLENEKIINSSNSSIVILDRSIFYKNKLWIPLKQLEEIAGIKTKAKNQIKYIDSQNIIKVNDSAFLSNKGISTKFNSYMYFVSREGCLKIIDHFRDSSISYSKEVARKNINSFFDQYEYEETKVKKPYTALIDISFGENDKDQLSCYADNCSDLNLALEKLLESEKFRKKSIGKEKASINVYLDKTLTQRQKL